MSKPAASPHAGLSSSAPVDDKASIREAQMSMRRVVHTLDFVRAIKQSKGSFKERVQKVADLLKKDADRPDGAWLIDLSLTLKGTSMPVMFELIHFLSSSRVDEDKEQARQLIFHQILPLGEQLLRSFDAAAVAAATGNNALHELSTYFYLNPDSWSRKLAELFLAHGVSVHARNLAGCTPLLQFASTCYEHSSSSSGLRLLLAHGADLNAQDNDGNSLLHLLVKCKAMRVLEDLLGGDGVSHMDCRLVNSAGQTAADLAAIQLAQQRAGAGLAWLHRLVLSYQEESVKRSRPIVQRCVEAVLVPDLAAIVVGYVDGGGKPFSTATDPKDAEKNSEPAAAASAAPAQ